MLLLPHVTQSLHVSPASDDQGSHRLSSFAGSPSQSVKNNSTSSCPNPKPSADRTPSRKKSPCSAGSSLKVHVSDTSVPQLDSFTFSKSLRRHSDGSEGDIELGYKVSSDSLANQTTINVATENTKDIKKTEKDEKWKTVWRKGKAEAPKQGKQRVSDRLGTQSASCHQRLMMFIMKTFPDLTVDQVNKITTEVKDEFGGHFHGQLFSDIIQKVKVVAFRRYPSALKSMNVTSSCCAICFEKLTPVTFEQLNCNHVFHKQCLMKKMANDRKCPLCYK